MQPDAHDDNAHNDDAHDDDDDDDAHNDDDDAHNDDGDAHNDDAHDNQVCSKLRIMMMTHVIIICAARCT